MFFVRKIRIVCGCGTHPITTAATTNIPRYYINFGRKNGGVELVCDEYDVVVGDDDDDDEDGDDVE